MPAVRKTVEVPGAAALTVKPHVFETPAGFAIVTAAGRISVTAAAVSGTRELFAIVIRYCDTSPGLIVAGVNWWLIVVDATATPGARAARTKAARRARPAHGPARSSAPGGRDPELRSGREREKFTKEPARVPPNRARGSGCRFSLNQDAIR